MARLVSPLSLQRPVCDVISQTIIQFLCLQNHVPFLHLPQLLAAFKRYGRVRRSSAQYGDVIELDSRYLNC